MIISKTIKKIFINKFVAKILMNSILKLHNLTYKLAAIFSSILNNNVHPKHDIINYKQWFYENVSSDDIIVDIGCNTGSMVSILAEKVRYVYGIEINENHYNEARLKIQKPNVEFFCFDATTYDYSECIDITVVTLSNVLEHIENRVDFLKNIIKQIPWDRGLQKKILIRVPMVDRDWITIYKKQMGIECRLDKTHYTEYTYLQFKDELNKSNIEILSHHIQYGELYAVCKAK